MGKRWNLLIGLLKPRFGWESRKKIAKENTRLREKISKYKTYDDND